MRWKGSGKSDVLERRKKGGGWIGEYRAEAVGDGELMEGVKNGEQTFSESWNTKFMSMTRRLIAMSRSESSGTGLSRA
jgi:hypothetical protein